MPSDSNGAYTLVSSYFVQNGDTILPVQHNPVFEDIAAGLTARLMSDGRTTMTGDLKLGANKVTGMADGEQATDAAAIGQVVRVDAAQALTSGEKQQAAANIGLNSASNSLGASMVGIEDSGAYFTATNVEAALAELLADPWAMQPVGAPIPVMDDVTGVAAPPTDKFYRYVLLTAGEDGVGDYNEGVLTNESVSGSAPDIVATADIDDGDSPMDGQTIRLLNTSREFLRPGASGTTQDSQNLLHGHQYAGSGYADNPGSDGGFTTNADNTYISDVHTGTASTDHGEQIGGSGGDEARPRNVGVTYYLRIK